MNTKRNLTLLKNIVMRKFYSPESNKKVIDEFHKLFYDSQTYNKVYWLGASASKCPFDLFIYQEILYDIKPDIIIECGTAQGGTTYFLATVCDLIGKGKIISMDIEDNPKKPIHKRIKYITGSSTDEGVFNLIKSSIKPSDIVLVILDSAHNKEHVLKELNMYNSLVTKGSYLIVEDSNLNGNPIFPTYGPGPKEAIDEFMKENNDFAADKEKEKFFLTFNPNGYLKKIK